MMYEKTYLYGNDSTLNRKTLMMIDHQCCFFEQKAGDGRDQQNGL